MKLSSQAGLLAAVWIAPVSPDVVNLIIGSVFICLQMFLLYKNS